MTSPTPRGAVDLVVFDMAGTTIDEGAVVYDALEQAVAEQGVTPSRDQLDAVKGMDKVTAVRTLLRQGGVDDGDEAVARGFDRFTTLLRRGYEQSPHLTLLLHGSESDSYLRAERSRTRGLSEPRFWLQW